MDKHQQAKIVAQAKIYPNGRITIPKSIRDHLGIGPGDKVDWRIEGDRLIMVPIPKDGSLNSADSPP